MLTHIVRVGWATRARGASVTCLILMLASGPTSGAAAQSISPSAGSTGERLQVRRPNTTLYSRLNSTAPVPESWNYVWASPGIGMERTLSGQRLLSPSGDPPAVKVNGVAATVLGATATAVRFQVPNLGAGFPGGPVEVTVEHSGGSATAPTPLILVTGPPVITGLSTLYIPLGAIATVTVTGNNLAGVDGLCLPGSPRFVPRMAPPTSNDQFQVHLRFPGPMNGPVKAGWGPASSPTCLGNPTPVTLQVW
jgi:hypothetical protein